MTVFASAPIGFIGLGSMGEPMALNLFKAGTPLWVWNRTRSKCDPLAEVGALVAEDPSEIFSRCKIVILMLINGEVMDEVLERGKPDFEKRVKGRTLVHMGTTEPCYSIKLQADCRAAGGHYIEAPVSGSRKQAEARELVSMLAGEPEAIKSIRPLLALMCKDVIVCGPVPNALYMKLAVNLFLINMVTSLAESFHFAERHGLDLEKFAAILNTGPMANEVSRIKITKLVSQDFAKQAGIADVTEIARLISCAAREAGIASPLIDSSHSLFAEAKALGLGEADMASVIRAIEQRTASVK